MDTHDVQVIRSNHKVNVDQGIIDTFCEDFFITHIHKSVQNLRESGTGGNMTACVLIEQCVEEHQTGLVDRGLLRNECNLAEHRSAVIHGEHFFQNFLALLCVAVNDSSVFKINSKVVDNLSGPAERFGGNKAAFAFAAHRLVKTSSVGIFGTKKTLFR